MESGDYPGVYAAADEVSLKAQRAYVWLTRAELGLMLTAAGLAALRVAIDPRGSLSATIVGTLLVIALALRTSNRIRRYDKTWFDGRAVAESVKSASWRFAMHMEPYDGTDEEATAELVAALEALLGERRELVPLLRVDPKSHLVGPALTSLRVLPVDERVRKYLVDRIQDQFEWYDFRSRSNRESAARWFWAGVVAQVLAIVIALASVSIPVLFAAIGFLSSVAASTTAWAQLGRHDELGRSYALAATELSLLKAKLESINPFDADELDERLRDAEGAISREHTMWIAKRA